MYVYIYVYGFSTRCRPSLKVDVVIVVLFVLVSTMLLLAEHRMREMKPPGEGVTNKTTPFYYATTTTTTYSRTICRYYCFGETIGLLVYGMPYICVCLPHLTHIVDSVCMYIERRTPVCVCVMKESIKR